MRMLQRSSSRIQSAKSGIYRSQMGGQSRSNIYNSNQKKPPEPDVDQYPNGKGVLHRTKS